MSSVLSALLLSDISSGVEYEDVLIKGKDESKVKAFINAVNN